MCRRPLHFTVQNGWVNVSLYNITYKNNKEYFLIVTVAVTVNVARVTVIVMVIVIVCFVLFLTHSDSLASGAGGSQTLHLIGLMNKLV